MEQSSSQPRHPNSGRGAISTSAQEFAQQTVGKLQTRAALPSNRLRCQAGAASKSAWGVNAAMAIAAQWVMPSTYPQRDFSDTAALVRLAEKCRVSSR